MTIAGANYREGIAYSPDGAMYVTPTGTASITGGAIDATPIGGTTPAAGAFTTLTSSGTTTLGTGAVAVTVGNTTNGLAPTIASAANTAINFSPNGALKWVFQSTTSHFVPASSNALDVGSSALLVRSGYLTILQGGNTKTLAETSATAFVAITIPSSGGVAGIVHYTVFAADATNTQIKSGQLVFSAVANSTGTVTAATVSDVNTLNPCSSGTLTNTMDSTTAANTLTLRANATSSLTQTTLEIRYRVETAGGTGTVTPQ